MRSGRLERPDGPAAAAVPPGRLRPRGRWARLPLARAGGRARRAPVRSLFRYLRRRPRRLYHCWLPFAPKGPPQARFRGELLGKMRKEGREPVLKNVFRKVIGLLVVALFAMGVVQYVRQTAGSPYVWSALASGLWILLPLAAAIGAAWWADRRARARESRGGR